MSWKPADLDEAVIYAKGWNDAVRAAAKIVEEEIDHEWPGDDLSNQAQWIADQIRALDKSMQAC